MPQGFDCLRHVPLYGDFIKERFERCLDLYLCPRWGGVVGSRRLPPRPLAFAVLACCGALLVFMLRGWGRTLALQE